MALKLSLPRLVSEVDAGPFGRVTKAPQQNQKFFSWSIFLKGFFSFWENHFFYFWIAVNTRTENGPEAEPCNRSRLDYEPHMCIVATKLASGIDISIGIVSARSSRSASASVCDIMIGSGLAWPGLVCMVGLPLVHQSDVTRLVCWSVGLVWSGLVWSGLVWPGLIWSGLVWSDLVLVWPGLAWPGLQPKRHPLLWGVGTQRGCRTPRQDPPEMKKFLRPKRLGNWGLNGPKMTFFQPSKGGPRQGSKNFEAKEVWSGLSCLVWCGPAWPGLAWPGLVWSGLVWSGLSGLVWFGLVWSGLISSVLLVLAWPGLVWSGLLWSGLVWSGLVWSGLVGGSVCLCVSVCVDVCGREGRKEGGEGEGGQGGEEGAHQELGFVSRDLVLGWCWCWLLVPMPGVGSKEQGTRVWRGLRLKENVEDFFPDSWYRVYTGYIECIYNVYTGYIESYIETGISPILSYISLYTVVYRFCIPGI